jgi:hypothetical protein
MTPNLNIRTVTEQTFTMELTAKDLRKALGLPDDAELEFFVPGGGDWSNTSVSLDSYPIYVSWKRTTSD